jgi:hypothetical protein
VFVELKPKHVLASSLCSYAYHDLHHGQN